MEAEGITPLRQRIWGRRGLDAGYQFAWGGSLSFLFVSFPLAARKGGDQGARL